jgi:hypothetical protein
MPNPLWLDDLFGALMVTVAVYSLGRLVAARIWARPIHRDVDVAHVLMGASMAGQLVSDLNPIPSWVWEVTFAAMACWFLWRCFQFVRNPIVESSYPHHAHRLSRRLIHLTMALAMLYMYLAAAPARIGTGMAMGTPVGARANFVLIPLVFILALLGSAVWTLDRIGHLDPSARIPEPIDESRAINGVPALNAADPGSHRAGSVAPAAAPEAAAPQAMRQAGAPPWLAPRLEESAHIVMVVTMAYMLVLML